MGRVGRDFLSIWFSVRFSRCGFGVRFGELLFLVLAGGGGMETSFFLYRYLMFFIFVLFCLR